MRAETLTDDTSDLSHETRVGLIAEGFHTWGEVVARELANALAVPFDECADEIERLRYRVQ